VQVRGVDLADPEIFEGLPYAAMYDRPDERVEVLLNEGDGQAFAALATDPALRRPEVFRDGPAEAAYRWQRPLLGYLAGAAAWWQREWVPEALAGLAVAAAGLTAGAVAAALRRRGASPWWALATVALPGAVVSVRWAGPELLGAALATFGVLAWTGSRRRVGAAAALFALAGLARETYLLVPLVVVAVDLLRSRQPWRRMAPRSLARTLLRPRSLVLLVVPVAAYAGWLAVVHARFGTWPWEASSGRLGLPGAGVAEVAGGWTAQSAVAALLLGVLALGPLVAGRRDVWAWLAAAYGAFGLLMGPLVWGRWQDFSRPLLCACLWGLVALAPVAAPAPVAAAAPGPDPDGSGRLAAAAS